jgi:hypothetical protein
MSTALLQMATETCRKPFNKKIKMSCGQIRQSYQFFERKRTDGIICVPMYTKPAQIVTILIKLT